MGVYIFMHRNEEKKGYVLNQRVFDEFKGKKELEQRLIALQNTHKARLDSITLLIQRQPANKELIARYNEQLKSFDLEQQDLSQRYTADIWKRINQYISEYGKKNGYSFIFGATGEGNLMYADDINNITDDVIADINKQYEAAD